MKARYFMLLQAVFLGLGLLVLTPTMNPYNSSEAKTSSPLQLNAGADVTSQPVGEPEPQHQRRPAQTPGSLGMHHELVRRRL